MFDVSGLKLVSTMHLYAGTINRYQERNYNVISLKDVDSMKKLFGFPPAIIFMLLADRDGICALIENYCLGNVTQVIVNALTGQIVAYLVFYEFFTDGVLVGGLSTKGNS